MPFCKGYTFYQLSRNLEFILLYYLHLPFLQFQTGNLSNYGMGAEGMIRDFFDQQFYL